MSALDHAFFIAAAYAAVVIVIGALLAWLVVDGRLQARRLAELEAQGIRRRKAQRSPGTEQG